MFGRLTLFTISFALLAGCGQQGTSATGTSPEPPKPVATGVDEKYKHDGYLYYGLGNETPQKMKIVRAGSTMEGEQTYKLDKVEDDGVTYDQVWTGGLPAADSKVKVTSEGVYGVEARGKKIDPPQMELPAKPAAGMAWKSEGKIEVDGSTISNSSSKIVGVQPVTVGGKKVDALVVKRSSTVTTGGITQTMTTTEYYQKGVGAVKLDVTMSGGGQPTQSFTMEAVSK